MDRRAFLRSSGVVLGATGAAGVLSACGNGDSEGSAGGGIPEGEPSLNPIVASFEVLTGTHTIPFGLRDLDNVEVADADVQVYLRNEDGTQVLGGPFPTRYTTPEGTQIGLYLVEVTFEEPGTPQLVAVEGDRYGATNVTVRTPETSELPAPGQAAIVTPTPTEGRDLGYETICTQEPQCGMHDVSLDEAIEQGRPVMLLFATPAYCQTVVCGPAVQTVENVRANGDFGDDVAWIHCEIYASYSPEEQSLGRPVAAWELPSEPWLFSIDANGDIADRADGPMFEERVEGFARNVSA